MKLFIPEIATRLVLTQDWSFNLYAEDRNDALLECFSVKGGMWMSRDEGDFLKKGFTKVQSDEYWVNYFKQVTLPVGSELTVDRIYIRRGASEFSSVSFNLIRKSVDETVSDFCKKIRNGKGRCRFWAKLDDVNSIEFTQ